MEVAMIFPPDIIELLMKERQRDLLAAADRIRVVRTGRYPTVKLTGNMVLFLANMLIQTGTSLKKCWMSWQLDQAPADADTGSL
jgi:hypothetical protein